MGPTLISGFRKGCTVLTFGKAVLEHTGLKTSSGVIGWNIRGIFKAGNFSWEFKGINET